jgi:hypothetical protein
MLQTASPNPNNYFLAPRKPRENIPIEATVVATYAMRTRGELCFSDANAIWLAVWVAERTAALDVKHMGIGFQGYVM